MDKDCSVDEMMRVVGEQIKETYAREAGLAVSDPDFWEKYNKLVSGQPEPKHQTDYCPCCGQEIE